MQANLVLHTECTPSSFREIRNRKSLLSEAIRNGIAEWRVILVYCVTARLGVHNCCEVSVIQKILF